MRAYRPSEFFRETTSRQMTLSERKRPYTPETLAERWECSPELIRRMLKSGELQGFKVGGKLWRIRYEVVEECPTG